MGVTRTGVINDLHLPFGDDVVIKLVLDAFEDVGLDRLVINGDLLDFYNVNMHGPKHPVVEDTLLDEINAGKEFLEDCRSRFPDAEIIFLYGNHEDRLERYILKNSKALWNVLNLDYMLRLDELNIKWWHYNHCYQLENSNLYIQHSPPSYGQNGARTSLLTKLDSNFIYGCTHRKQVACMTGFSGEVYSVYFNGWLGSTTATPAHAKVFSYAKGHTNWQQAGIMVTVLDGTEFFVDQFEIKNNKLLLDGAIYEA